MQLAWMKTSTETEGAGQTFYSSFLFCFFNHFKTFHSNLKLVLWKYYLIYQTYLILF